MKGLEPEILCKASCSDDDALLTPQLNTTEGVVEGDEMEFSHPRKDARDTGSPDGEGERGESKHFLSISTIANALPSSASCPPASRWGPYSMEPPWPHEYGA